MLLRWTLLGILTWLGAVTSPGALSTQAIVGLVAFAVVNLAVSFLPERLFRGASMEFSLGLLDCSVMSFLVTPRSPRR